MGAYDANQLDFLDEGGVADAPSAPAMTEEQKQRARDAAAKRAEDARLAGIPYGTPVDKGGTAAVYEFLDENIGTHAQPTTQQSVRLIQPSSTGAASGSAVGAGATGDIADAAGLRSDEGNTDRSNALQSLIDRFDAAKDSFDTQQQDQSRQAQQLAQSQNRELFTRAMNFDPGAAVARSSEEALSRSLAVARSAPGGASRASALMNALQAQPGIQAEATRQANAEGRQQQNVALQASGQLGQLATQTRGQDEAQSEAVTGIGLDVAKQIANFTGLDLQLDQRDREFLGEVALQAAQLNLDVEKLGVEESLRMLELQLQKEGLQQEWRLFKESQKITGKDILGGIFGLAGSVTSGLFTGLAAKK